MQFRGILGFLAVVAVSFSVGCSMTKSTTVRGQGPENNGPIIGSAPGYGDLIKSPHMGRHDHHDFKPSAGISSANAGYEGGFYAPDTDYTQANIVRRQAADGVVVDADTRTVCLSTFRPTSLIIRKTWSIRSRDLPLAWFSTRTTRFAAPRTFS